MSKKLYLYSFYRFTVIHDKKIIKQKLDEYLSLHTVRGTILLANEGINGSISAQKKDLDNIIKFIRNLLKIRKINLKINSCKYLPFNRMKVRLKKEIVSLGKGEIKINSTTNKYVSPLEWNKIINENDVNIIDVRNDFEIGIGKFQNAYNLKTKSFREFPNKIKSLNLSKHSKIAMYCTGGIRCEKASSYLKSNGYKDIVQLEGGIINYLDFTKKNKLKNLWNGECFVFDNRVTVNKYLSEGKYKQCYGCRRPITLKDIKSFKYKKGVTCPYCFYERTSKQKNNSLMRQKQIDSRQINNLKNTE
tara:strand:- start:141 stop:1052 length:912 start_codon:yes stop_codon:yes gene_type:complete